MSCSVEINVGIYTSVSVDQSIFAVNDIWINWIMINVYALAHCLSLMIEKNQSNLMGEVVLDES